MVNSWLVFIGIVTVQIERRLERCYAFCGRLPVIVGFLLFAVILLTSCRGLAPTVEQLALVVVVVAAATIEVIVVTHR